MSLYVFKKFNNSTRLELIKSTQDYSLMDRLLRNHGGQASLVVPPSFRRKSGYGMLFSIKLGNKIITSCLAGSPSQLIGYGEINGTNDAVIFKINNSIIEVFIFEKKAQKKFDVFISASYGKLDPEFLKVRSKLKLHALSATNIQLGLSF